MKPSTQILVAFASLFLCAGVASAGSGLRVGTCLREITPVSPNLAAAYQAQFGVAPVINHTNPVYMAGFGDNRIATGYNDRMWARGVVIDGREGRVAIVAVDLIGYFLSEVETIRGLVSPASEIDQIIVHSTHQHEGPDTIGIWGPDPTTSGIDFAYLDFINSSVADCLDEAVTNLQKARMRLATADSSGLSIGSDPDDDGYGVGDTKVLEGDALLAPATQGRIVDPRIAVMQFTARKTVKRDDDSDGDSDRDDGKKHFPVLATLVNFGSHPESLGVGNTLTSDFPHYVRERIEAEYGGLAIWVSGAVGVLQGPLHIDVLDPATGAPAVRRTFRWAEVHGTQLAERAIEALGAAKRKGKSKPRISFGTTSPVAIRLDNPFFRFFIALGVINSHRGLFTDGVADASVGFPFPGPFSGIPQALGADIHTEVSALRIGDASIAVVPGELDPQIGDVYRARMLGAKHTFIIGLGNDELGYQMPAEKWDNSCHACAVFIFGDVPEFCPFQPIDCNTVFENNVGADMDPSISGALLPLIDALH